MFIEAVEFVYFTSCKIALLHNTATSKAHLPLPWRSAYQRLLRIQAFVVSLGWTCACRDTVLGISCPRRDRDGGCA